MLRKRNVDSKVSYEKLLSQTPWNHEVKLSDVSNFQNIFFIF